MILCFHSGSSIRETIYCSYKYLQVLRPRLGSDVLPSTILPFLCYFLLVSSPQLLWVVPCDISRGCDRIRQRIIYIKAGLIPDIQINLYTWRRCSLKFPRPDRYIFLAKLGAWYLLHIDHYVYSCSRCNILIFVLIKFIAQL